MLHKVAKLSHVFYKHRAICLLSCFWNQICIKKFFLSILQGKNDMRIS